MLQSKLIQTDHNPLTSRNHDECSSSYPPTTLLVILQTLLSQMEAIGLGGLSSFVKDN